MKYFLLICAAVLIVSCISYPDHSNINIQTIEDLTIENIETAMDSEDIGLVLEYISTLERTGNQEDKNQLDNLLSNASLLVNKLFSRAIEKKLFFEASRIYIIAREAGLVLPKEWTHNKLILAYVYKEEENISSSLRSYLIRNFLDLDLIENDDIINLFDIVADGGDKSLIKQFLQEADQRSLELNTDVITNYEDISKIDLLKGTVTIWVNRGMKIEGGIGVPDSVIGSGFFIDKTGYLLTNYHVIESEVDPEFEGFSRLYVRLWDDQNTKIPAKVVGWDRVFDIALLKVELVPEVIFSFSNGKEYLPGTPIIAIGSPGGLENTITSGIVSATGRKFLQMGSVIQVDVPINHGNSGGPLIDEEGELVGVVFAGIEQFEGINFAIPGSYLAKLIPSLYKGGRVDHPFLGLAVQEESQGLRIIYRTPGGGGSRTGLENGDIITKVMDIDVHKIEDVNKIFLGLEPGMIIQMDWLRDGIEMNGIFSLGIRPDFPLYDASKIDLEINLIPPVFGMEINSISESIFGSEYMVTEVFPGSIADITGLSINDPFSIKKWEIIDDQKLIIMQIKIKKRKAGFLESGVQLGAYMGTSNFI
ncbi:MAG: trypsin-like peptidase domain-containing protein [Spirochaetales bacterium]|nr:trypsin-like peptidase domain-containing protein [Spirochaetales bacterium]